MFAPQEEYGYVGNATPLKVAGAPVSYAGIDWCPAAHAVLGSVPSEGGGFGEMNASPETAANLPARPRRIRRWLTIIALSLAGVLVLIVAIGAAVILRPDLSRDQLGEYVSTDSRFLELPGGAVAHYRDQGSPDAPALVLIHGGLGSLHNWEPWIPKLVKDYRVVSLDLPGHGLTGRIPGDVYTRESMVEFVSEVLVELDIDRFALAGHSMGGGVALLYALERPEQVGSLILVGPEGVPGDEGYDVDGVFTNPDADPTETAIDQIELTLLERLLTKVGSPWVVGETLRYMVARDELVTPEFAARFGRILRHEGNRHAIALMFRQYAAVMHDPRDLEPRLGELELPVLLQIGERDALVPPMVGERFHAGLSRSTLNIYPDTGHMIMQEATETSVADALRFLERSRSNEELVN